MITDMDTAIRLFLSLLLGGIVGYERQASNKAAGLRTHVLVCMGSCLIMVLSINIYQTVEGLTNADPARLAAQVISGIGFLGAGTIMKEGPTVTGLTTAASIWVVAGIGLAVGAGYYSGAIMATVFAFGTLSLLYLIERRMREKSLLRVVVRAENDRKKIGELCHSLSALGADIRDIRVKEEKNHTELAITFLVSMRGDEERLPLIRTACYNHDGVFSVVIK